ncbi:MAG: DUF695 domain-containing protein [Candidatus Melainabacteria bacterium]|nr:DUF695 domain-containing protein [Candidatus Melainabacteria bacterium]
MLPFQIHLHQAIESLEAQDLITARMQAERFFEELDNHPIALDIALGDSQRQIFEPYYFGSLMPERCAGYEIMAHIALQSGQYDQVLQNCKSSLGLIDDFLGRNSPEKIEESYRIPHFPHAQSTIASIFSKTAHLMSLAYGGKGDREQAERWQNIFRSSLADQNQPDLVWERWLSENDEALPQIDFFDWELADKYIDGQIWITNIGRRAHEDLDLAKAQYCLCVTVHNNDCESMSKKSQWEHWSLRNAIDAQMIRGDLGRRVLDAYHTKEGTRRFFYYCYERKSIEAMLEPIGKAASATLSFRSSILHDPDWTIYQDWGGHKLISPRKDNMTGESAEADEMARELRPMPDGSLKTTEATARIVCQIGENIAALQERVYTLSCVIERLLPGMDSSGKLFCLNYFDDLLAKCSKDKQILDRALLLAIWKVGDLDETGARRRQWWHTLRESVNLKASINALHIQFAMAAESLSSKDPEIALGILDTLDLMAPHLPIDSYRASIAARLSRPDLMAHALREMRASNHPPPTHINGLIEKANLVLDMDREFARDLLIEARETVITIPNLFERAQTIGNIARSANRIAPDMVPELCRQGLEISIKLEKLTPDPSHWFDYTGPNFAAWIAVDMGGYMVCRAGETREPADLIFAVHAFERAIALLHVAPDNFQMLFHVSRIAQALGELSDWHDRSVIEPLLVQIWQVCANTVFFEPQNLKEVEQALTPLAAIIKADSAMAAKNLETILDICRSPKLPEKIIEALCFIARQFDLCAPDLLSAARLEIQSCCSPYLRALSAGNILDSTPQKQDRELEATADTNFAEITDLNARIDYLLDRARRNQSDKSYQWLLQAQDLALANAQDMPAKKMLEKLSALESRKAAPVYLRFLLSSHKYPRLGEALLQWADGLQEGKTDIFWPS